MKPVLGLAVTLAATGCGTYVWEHPTKAPEVYNADLAICKRDVSRGMPPWYMAGIYAREKIADCMRARGWQLRHYPA